MRTDELKTAFGRAVKALRTERGLTQETLAYESGVDRSYLSELENGRKMPSLDTVFRLATALGLSASDLIADVEG